MRSVTPGRNWLNGLRYFFRASIRSNSFWKSIGLIAFWTSGPGLSAGFGFTGRDISAGERGGNTTRTFSQRPNVTWVTGQFAKTS